MLYLLMKMEDSGNGIRKVGMNERPTARRLVRLLSYLTFRNLHTLTCNLLVDVELGVLFCQQGIQHVSSDLHSKCSNF